MPSRCLTAEQLDGAADRVLADALRRHRPFVPMVGDIDRWLPLARRLLAHPGLLDALVAYRLRQRVTSEEADRA